ncbi:hypothetical protein DFA_11187 [Cavenderia fasciculata]|uniref:BP74 N-terminal domain-containing protein n=1 Tax=Cavenderia fasciculata TaxID=261658 RepID=F4QFB9_CACFS|nr:uncharacterized protein DFA_11187 [Cavenderia fasciculata]EGG13426.1 hypothetical protein DFA_11187 [Cavenderia fasciculata]|eukprot:XP_004350130.1 hypothetical protein DFA_11187 [Cavenderia fasciculata]
MRSSSSVLNHYCYHLIFSSLKINNNNKNDKFQVDRSNNIGDEVAYFVMADKTTRGKDFIIKITNNDSIQTGRDYLAGRVPKLYVAGRIIPTTVSYNPLWSFHLAPEYLDFYHVALGQCDAPIFYTEENLPTICELLFTNCFWCPYDARIVREVPASSLMDNTPNRKRRIN